MACTFLDGLEENENAACGRGRDQEANSLARGVTHQGAPM